MLALILILLQLAGDAGPTPFLYQKEKTAHLSKASGAPSVVPGYFKSIWPDSLVGTNIEGVAVDSLGDIYAVCVLNNMVARSSDGGSTWVASLTTNSYMMRTIIAGPNVLAAGWEIQGAWAKAGTDDWYLASGFPNYINGPPYYGYSPKTHTVFTAMYYWGGTIYRSTDYGETWTASDGYHPLDWYASLVNTIAADTVSGFIYAGTGGIDTTGREGGDGIWKSTDDGLNWEHIAGMDRHYITSVAVENGTLYAATMGSGLFCLAGDSTWVSIPGPVVADKPDRLRKEIWALQPTKFGLLVGFWDWGGLGLYLLRGTPEAPRWDFLGLSGEAIWSLTIDKNDYIYAGLTSRLWKSVVPLDSIVVLLNSPPKITAYFPAMFDSIGQNATVRFSVAAADSDGDSLSYTWRVNGAVVDSDRSDSLLYTFPEPETRATVTCIARDSLGASDSVTWSFRVVGIPPRILSYIPTSLDSVNLGTPTLFSVTATDSSGSPLSYTWKMNGLVIDSVRSDSLTWTFRNLNSRQILVCVVSNRWGVSDSVTWNFVVTGISSHGFPKVFALSQNYPNPFNPETSIKYSVSSMSHITMRVYDILGREVAILIDEREAPGFYEIRFDGSHLPSGIYFYRLRTSSGFTAVKKMILLK